MFSFRCFRSSMFWIVSCETLGDIRVAASGSPERVTKKKTRKLAATRTTEL